MTQQFAGGDAPHYQPYYAQSLFMPDIMLHPQQQIIHCGLLLMDKLGKVFQLLCIWKLSLSEWMYL
jgi:hypothetical protein